MRSIFLLHPDRHAPTPGDVALRLQRGPLLALRATDRAFAALRAAGDVVTWGDPGAAAEGGRWKERFAGDARRNHLAVEKHLES